MMMDALNVPGRVPQGRSMRDGEMLSSIFSALPAGVMLKALESVGVQVREPQSQLAPSDESNQIDNWNNRRVVLNGQTERGPIYNRNKVIELAPTISRVAEPPYLSPQYDSSVDDMSLLHNAQGGF